MQKVDSIRQILDIYNNKTKNILYSKELHISTADGKIHTGLVCTEFDEGINKDEVLVLRNGAAVNFIFIDEIVSLRFEN